MMISLRQAAAMVPEEEEEEEEEEGEGEGEGGGRIIRKAVEMKRSYAMSSRLYNCRNNIIIDNNNNMINNSIINNNNNISNNDDGMIINNNIINSRSNNINNKINNNNDRELTTAVPKSPSSSDSSDLADVESRVAASPRQAEEAEERARMSRTSLFLWHTRHDDVPALRSLLRQHHHQQQQLSPPSSGYGGGSSPSPSPSGYGGGSSPSPSPSGYGGGSSPSPSPSGYGGGSSPSPSPSGYGGTLLSPSSPGYGGTLPSPSSPSSSSLVGAHDYDGRTALHVAAFYNCLTAASFLLAHGAPVNAQDRWGNSPLADAQGKGHREMEKLLKENGGQLLGNHGARLGTKAVAPPLPHKCDWEVDPEELDFSSSLLIGKGGFGEIRRAMWRGTPVAIKKILPSLSDDSLTIRDFRNELELLVKLRHPNVVQFLGAVTSKPLMLVTEYLGAGDLHSYLKEKGALPASTALGFAQDIARGMIYLHNEGKCIIHRDLKPRNLLLLENNHVKVADFGLSKIFPTRQTYTLTGETGSYRYMAPEVFLHKPYDTKVDVFSFAMILYQMFEGEAPLSEMVAYEAAKRMARDDMRPKLRAKTYPSHMKELIQRCWSENPKDRLTFKEILTCLEKMEPEVVRSERSFWPF